MHKLRIPFQVILFKEDGRWNAHCLEFNLSADGTTRDLAVQRINQAIRMQFEASIAHANMENLFMPSHPRLYIAFAAGSVLDRAEFKMSLKIQSAEVYTDEIREYSGDASSFRRIAPLAAQVTP